MELFCLNTSVVCIEVSVQMTDPSSIGHVKSSLTKSSSNPKCSSRVLASQRPRLGPPYVPLHLLGATTGRPLTHARAYTITRQPCRDAMTKPLSHLTSDGSAHMVDISQKKPTYRSATARSLLYFSRPETYGSLRAANSRKGDAIAVARIAAIQAAKQTANLIPLAHPSLSITGVTVDIEPFAPRERRAKYVTSTEGGGDTELVSKHGGAEVTATVSCDGKTGVEMEALTAATVGSVTLYDMLKGVDKGMVINDCRVIRKQGGKSGGWSWDEPSQQLMKEEPRVAHEETRLQDGIQATKVSYAALQGKSVKAPIDDMRE